MPQFLTSKAVCDRVAISRATLDRLVAADRFPKPIRLTQRRIVYSQADVDAWMTAKMERAA